MGAFLQGNEIIILALVVALLILGPTKLPALARAFGQAIHEFRKAANAPEDAEKQGA